RMGPAAGQGESMNAARRLISRDLADLIFRLLFCLIVVGLGGEHIFSDALIQQLMPAWMPYPRLVSIVCGVWLCAGGALIALGWRLDIAAVSLGAFLIVVTVVVHFPGLFTAPVPVEHLWMWQILQRTNFVK